MIEPWILNRVRRGESLNRDCASSDPDYEAVLDPAEPMAEDWWLFAARELRSSEAVRFNKRKA